MGAWVHGCVHCRGTGCALLLPWGQSRGTAGHCLRGTAGHLGGTNDEVLLRQIARLGKPVPAVASHGSRLQRAAAPPPSRPDPLAHREAVGLVVKVDVHDRGRAGGVAVGRQHVLPVRKVLAAEVAVRLAPGRRGVWEGVARRRLEGRGRTTQGAAAAAVGASPHAAPLLRREGAVSKAGAAAARCSCRCRYTHRVPADCSCQRATQGAWHQLGQRQGWISGRPGEGPSRQIQHTGHSSACGW